MRSRLPVIAMVSGGALLFGLAACGDSALVDPVDEEPEVRPQVVLSTDRMLCRHPCETQGVLGLVLLTADVFDEAGEPVVDQTVQWRIRSGRGLLNWQGPGGAWPPGLHADTVATTSTAQDGNSVGVRWRLGGRVGIQAVEAWVEGGDTAIVEVDAVPGAVLVARANRESLSYFDSLPADTLRIHIADVDYIERSAEVLAEHGTGFVSGSILPGPGVDPNWTLFHLDPLSTRAVRPGTWLFYCLGLPNTPEALDEVQERMMANSLYRRSCPAMLELVAIEEVPEWYLDQLARSAPGRDHLSITPQ
jgi:hypothetical protein